MVKMYSLYKLFELKFSGKTSEEKYAASLGTKAKQIFLTSAITLKICQKHRDSTSHIERTVNVLGEGPTKIKITNASIDKQITLKRDYIYKIENTHLEKGVSGVLLRILFYFEARRCSRQLGSVYALRINLLNIMIQKTLLRGCGASIIMKLNESNKEVKYKKKNEFTWTRTQDLLVVNSVPKLLD